jgi:tripartite-type tricarboxylate transporter receptor subunit TctC/uncharacterized protein YjiS (DUF1127 family)
MRCVLAPRPVRRTVALLTAWIAALAATACGPERPYPGREIRLVVHASPGGISDAVSRHVSRGLQDRLGVPVVAENRVGAAGSLALSFVARSRPDGYTIGYAPVDMTIIPHLGYSRVALDDFDYLTLHTRAPGALAVRTDSGLVDVTAFAAAARERQVSMGTSGSGSIWHLAGLALGSALDVPLAFVPFAGSGQAVTALLGGHVDAVVAAPFEVDAHVRAGNVRVLGVMARERSQLLPDVPTFPALGYPDLTIDAWGGFLAPRGLPDDRRQRLLDALHDVLSGDDFARFARERGLEVQIVTGDAFERFVHAESRQFEQLVRRAGLGLLTGSPSPRTPRARGDGVPATDRAGVRGLACPGAAGRAASLAGAGTVAAWRRARRAREGGARGDGVPATDRAGVRGLACPGAAGRAASLAGAGTVAAWRRARRAREGGARGDGVPATDRAGVRGLACPGAAGRAASLAGAGTVAAWRRARRAREGGARGHGVPATDRAGVRGGAPVEE